MRAVHERREYGGGLQLYAGRVRDLEFLAHWHADVELLYITSGSLIATVNQDRRLLGEGALVVCGSRDIHHYESSGEASESLLLIFKPEVIGHSVLWPPGRRLSRNFASIQGEPELVAEIRALMGSILAEMQARRPSYELVARGSILVLCGLAARALTSVDGPEETRFPALERMQRAIDFVYASSARPIGLLDAAEAAALSPSYFSRIFSKTVGSTFRAFLNRIRIERAEELMAGSPATVAEIALECGFESVRTFNRAYRALRGHPPSAGPRGRAPSAGRA